MSRSSSRRLISKPLRFVTSPPMEPATKRVKSQEKEAARYHQDRRVARRVAAKRATKPATKPAIKPATKPATKPAIKPATKPAIKTAIKTATKTATKPDGSAKKGTKWTPLEFNQLLVSSLPYWNQPGEQRSNQKEFGELILACAHEDGYLLNRSSGKSCYNQLSKTRAIWRDVQVELNESIVREGLVRPARVPSGGRSSADDFDFEAEMAVYQQALEDLLDDACVKVIGEPAEHHASWKAMYWESGTAMAGPLEGPAHAEAKAKAKAKAKTRKRRRGGGGAAGAAGTVDLTKFLSKAVEADEKLAELIITGFNPAPVPAPSAAPNPVDPVMEVVLHTGDVNAFLNSFELSPGGQVAAEAILTENFICSLGDFLLLSDDDIRSLFPQVGLRNRLLRCVNLLSQTKAALDARPADHVEEPSVEPVASSSSAVAAPSCFADVFDDYDYGVGAFALEGDGSNEDEEHDPEPPLL